MSLPQRLASVKTKALLVSERRMLTWSTATQLGWTTYSNRVGAIKLARVGLAVLSFGTSELAHAAAHEGAVSAAEAFIQSSARFSLPVLGVWAMRPAFGSGCPATRGCS